jgi:hypothetical protein
VSELRGSTLAVRFLCELSMLAALAFWGFQVGDGVGAWMLGIGAPLLAAAVWGAFVAPKAPTGMTSRSQRNGRTGRLSAPP